MEKKIPIVMCIDVEPDDRVTDRNKPAPWTGYEKSYEFFSELRPRLASATGSSVHFSWFFRMDPQVAITYGDPAWSVTNYPQFVNEFKINDDALGLHPHAWRWDKFRRTWIADHGNQEWINHCVRTSFEAYKEALQQDCEAVRFGDHWMSDATLDCIEKMGARYDLTLEPGQKAVPALSLKESFTGSLPDYSRILCQPYRPSRANFKKRSLWRKRPLWMIPLSAGSIEGPKASRLRRVKRFAESLGINRNRNKDSMTLNLCIDSSVFCQILDGLLTGIKTPYLALVVRTDVCNNAIYRPNLEQSFDYILSHPLVDRFVFETPAEAVKRLT